ncbi:MAG: ASKHA domain-containing protein [Lachnospiraceae bacterium]|nr:ASKHA domain-containing protein [Lachnospiraceae bacterium]
MNRDCLIECKKDETVLDALRRQGITIKAFCNGRRKCGKCRVLCDDERMCKPSHAEVSLLTEEESAAGVRLACFLFPVDGDVPDLKISILDELFNEAPILTSLGDLYPDDDEGGDTFAAFDLGTTTIAVKLVDRGRVIYTGSRRNSQCSFGADVISRSEASIKGAGAALSRCLKNDIDELINELPCDPMYLIMAGNTTIIHLLMEYPLDEMVNFPFKPYYCGWHKYRYLTDDGRSYECTILPNISAYIGGDIVSGLYYCGFDVSEEINVFLDLGTNGEMAVGNKDRILTASAAAGPAFEGTHINVATDVVRCVASLKEWGVIDENGSLKDPYFDTGYPYETDKGYVTISQRDIRDIQMAKSAIRAGLTILLRKYGVSEDRINKLYLAGGMGHSLDIDSAVAIGLIPPSFKDRAVPVGNASLAGCIKYGNRDRDDSGCEAILKVSGEAILSNESDFSELYYEYMMIREFEE